MVKQHVSGLKNETKQFAHDVQRIAAIYAKWTDKTQLPIPEIQENFINLLERFRRLFLEQMGVDVSSHKNLIENLNWENLFFQQPKSEIVAAKLTPPLQAIISDTTEKTEKKVDQPRSDDKLVTKKGLAQILMAQEHVVFDKNTWTFSEFLRSPLSSHFQTMCLQVITMDQDKLVQLGEWYDRFQAEYLQDTVRKLVLSTRWFMTLQDAIWTEIVMNPSMQSVERIYLRTQTCANIIRELRLSSFSFFNNWLLLPRQIADCKTIQQLRNALNSTNSSGIRPWFINYDKLEWSTGQWSTTELSRTEDAVFPTKVDLLHSHSSYAELFPQEVDRRVFMQKLFDETHKASSESFSQDHSTGEGSSSSKTPGSSTSKKYRYDGPTQVPNDSQSQDPDQVESDYDDSYQPSEPSDGEIDYNYEPRNKRRRPPSENFENSDDEDINFVLNMKD